MYTKILTASLFIGVFFNGCSNNIPLLPKVEHLKTKKFQGCHDYPMSATKSGTVLKNGVQVYVHAWGYDKSDGSGVGIDQDYPAPCFDDVPSRRGSPNAAWQGNFYQKGEQICFTVENLFSQYPPAHTLLGGYEVELVGGTFEDGSRKKVLPIFSFRGKPKYSGYERCEKIIVSKGNK